MARYRVHVTVTTSDKNTEAEVIKEVTEALQKAWLQPQNVSLNKHSDKPYTPPHCIV